MARLHNPHPGEILKEEFLNEIGMSQNRLAHAIGVPGNRVHAIVNGTRDVTADTDLRLCKFFGLSEGYFLCLQNAYDLLEAKRSGELPAMWQRSSATSLAGRHSRKSDALARSFQGRCRTTASGRI
jgi:antitoxin HigA-1